MSVIKCNQCVQDAFRVPYDIHGIALMEMHLKEAHGIHAHADIAQLEHEEEQ